MTDIALAGCEPRTLLSHMALYGLGSILESVSVHDVRLGWTGSSSPRPYVSTSETDGLTIAARLGQHALALDAAGSWVHEDITLKGTLRGLMSPRLSLFDEETWPVVQSSRWEALDALTTAHRWLDLRFLDAMGEPSYWRFSKTGVPLQDDGASRFEMQPRNQGSEFVGNRLRKLASTVALREPAKILAGLTGEITVDEIGGGKSDSRTPTGLASPGPTDNALAWCALWGISQFPIAMRVNATAVTSGHINQRRTEWFYVPIWHGPWRPARLRSVLASAALGTLAAAGLELKGRTDADVSAARSWLDKRGVAGVVRFPIMKFGSDNAPERRAMRGEVISARGRA